MVPEAKLMSRVCRPGVPGARGRGPGLGARLLRAGAPLGPHAGAPLQAEVPVPQGAGRARHGAVRAVILP